MTPEQATLLRRPFDPRSIGKLPKGGTVLDFVGHAAVTDRLIAADPAWTWEPLATDESGLPAYDRAGGLWIKLTVCGVTRLGYGDGPDPKQRIGDAIRNAAMRFGVALDLWSRQELEGTDPNGGDAAANDPRSSRKPPPAAPPTAAVPERGPVQAEPRPAPQAGEFTAQMVADLAYTHRADRRELAKLTARATRLMKDEVASETGEIITLGALLSHLTQAAPPAVRA